MTCETSRRLLDAYHDGELTDVERIVELEGHLDECPGCASALAGIRAVSGAVRQAPYYAAPERLRRAVRPRRVAPLWLAAAACLGLALLLAWRSSSRLSSELVADHVRSLQAQHLFDVASSSQHTVRPWFQGKLDFAPSVPDLSAEGFPLLGGRLDYVGDHPAAALVYRRDRHIIDVFVFRGPSLATSSERDGFHLVQWPSGGLTYAAVSDLNAPELRTFAARFQSRQGD